MELASGLGAMRDGAPESAAATPPSPDPGALLVRHAGGDATAFAELVAAYRRPVYSWLVRSGVSEADRDDLFQQIFLRLHRAANQYRPERPAHPWIFTVVANQVRTYLRRRRIRELVQGPAPAAEPAAEGPDAQRASDARETVDWVERELPRLPAPQREALLLVAVQDRPLAEAAAILGRPVNTVKTHLRRARLQLAERLARHRGEEGR